MSTVDAVLTGVYIAAGVLASVLGAAGIAGAAIWAAMRVERRLQARTARTTRGLP